MSEITIELPELHPDQVKAFEIIWSNRYSVVRAGRRWGKTDLGKVIAADGVINGEEIGWFAPDHKTWSEAFTELKELLDPIATRGTSKGAGVIRTKTRGRIDFWTLENQRAGRSRKYRKVIIDEGAFTDNATMMDVWEKSIKPTLVDYAGICIVLSNSNGKDPENFLYRICPQPGELISKYGFAEYHAPTHNNPFLPRAEVDALQANNHPLAYAQEHLAEFVDWSGVAFFERGKLLDNGQPVEDPGHCAAVFAIIDTATKTGTDNDGTGVIYFAIGNKGTGWPLIILDYELIQIEGSLLETWLPGILANLEDMARKHRARMGSLGAWIEDKSSGMVLLQHALAKKWKARPIDSKLTSLGKDERALKVSSFVYRGMVKLTRLAHDKTVTYKRETANHLTEQIFRFRVGDKDHRHRADDLLDCFCYGIHIALDQEWSQ